MKKFYFLALLVVMIHALMSCSSSIGQSGNDIDQNSGKGLNKAPEKMSYGEHDKVRTGMLDSAGNLWFGTSNEGVYRYDGKAFEQFTTKDGLCSNFINCIVEDQTGNMWFGTNDGLGKFDGNSFTEVALPWNSSKEEGDDWWNSLIVQSMLEDSNGTLWIGTGGHGIFKFDGETFENIVFTNDAKQSDGKHHNYIQSMMEDSEGNLWFTSMTHGGITKYDGNEFIHYSEKDGLLDDMVVSGFQDSKGKLWFGSIQTKHEGLYFLEGELFKGFGKEDGLCDNFVTGFYEDKEGTLWITTGSLLCLFDGSGFSPFLNSNAEEIKGIGIIIEDQNQNLWLGGSFGQLWKYNGKTMEDFSQKGR